MIDAGSEASVQRETRLRFVLNVVLVGILCYASNEIGFAHKILPHNISVLWPTSAILLSVLLVARPVHWWAYVLAAYFSSVIRDARAGFPAEGFLFLGAGLLEILGAAFVLRRYLDPLRMFDSLRGIALYLAIAVIGAPGISAFVSASAGGAEHYWFFWRVWFLSEGLAQLTLAPAILSWIALTRNGLGTVSTARWVEASALFCAVALVGSVAFTGEVPGGHGIPAMVYLPLPFLLWAAVRFGPMGMTTSLLIVAFLSISGAVHGRGPFASSGEWQDVISLQLFLGTVSVPLLLLAAVIHESREKAQVLRESESRFRSMADNSPVMIWMSGPDRKCEYFNKPWLNFTGRTLEQELGDGWVEGVHPEDRQHCLRVYTESFDARRPFEMEYRLRHRNGDHRWVIDCGVPRFMPDGSFTGYIGSCLDIAERKLSEAAARDLSGRLIRAQEDERRRLARELHDDLSQSLALLSVDIEMFGRSPPDGREVISGRMKELSATVKGLSSEVHRLSHELHPAKLEQLGLAAAIRGFCKELGAAHQIAIEFEPGNVPRQLPDDVALCLYRITQEALRNVVKHSRATSARVELVIEGPHLRLTITDEGCGFEVEASPGRSSLGIVSMRERVRMVQGQISVQSRPSEGTCIEVRIPVAPDGKDES
jgi:PAS domain S-box-containing protein